MSESISVNVTTREGELRTVTQGAGHDTLMQVLYEEDIGVEAICGGCTSCATCHVLIEPEWMAKLPERDQAELMLLQYAEHYDPERSRLSCQLQLGLLISCLLNIAPSRNQDDCSDQDQSSDQQTPAPRVPSKHDPRRDLFRCTNRHRLCIGR